MFNNILKLQRFGYIHYLLERKRKTNFKALSAYIKMYASFYFQEPKNVSYAYSLGNVYRKKIFELIWLYTNCEYYFFTEDIISRIST